MEQFFYSPELSSILQIIAIDIVLGGDNAIVIADNSLAKSILNWKPKRNLEDMCRDGWNWQLNNPNGYE